MPNNNFAILRNYTNNIALLWQNARGIAPDAVADKTDQAMLNWLVQLTDALGIWIDKGIQMTDGELILARTNIGAIVESWLKLFCCAYYEDYIREQPTGTRDPEQLRMIDLQNFSQGRLWDANTQWNAWVDGIRNQRNGIHSFLFRDIGTPMDFLMDVDTLLDFVRLIAFRLPPLEDGMEHLPDGYILNPEQVPEIRF